MKYFFACFLVLCLGLFGCSDGSNPGPSFNIPTTPNQFAKFFAGKWESEAIKDIGLDDSVSITQNQLVFIYSPDKRHHGSYESSFKRDAGKWSKNNFMEKATWSVSSVDGDTNQAIVRGMYFNRHDDSINQRVRSREWKITMVSETEFHIVTQFSADDKRKVVWRKTEEQAPNAINVVKAIRKLEEMGAKVSFDVAGYDNRATSLELRECNDAALLQMKELTELRRVDLWGGYKNSGGQITDAGLAHLKDLTNLTRLNLGNNPITDAGLVHLKGLTNLTYLGLEKTKVTDAGLVHLKGLTKLETLSLRDRYTDDGKRNTYQITAKAVKAFNTVVPKCKVFYDTLGPGPGSGGPAQFESDGAPGMVETKRTTPKTAESDGFDLGLVGDPGFPEGPGFKLPGKRNGFKTPKDEPALRLFTDNTGQHTVNAKFVTFNAGKAVLEKEDGSRVSLSMNELSNVDQVYIRQILKENRGSAEKPTSKAGDFPGSPRGPGGGPVRP